MKTFFNKILNEKENENIKGGDDNSLLMIAKKDTPLVLYTNVFKKYVRELMNYLYSMNYNVIDITYEINNSVKIYINDRDALRTIFKNVIEKYSKSYNVMFYEYDVYDCCGIIPSYNTYYITTTHPIHEIINLFELSIYDAYMNMKKLYVIEKNDKTEYFKKFKTNSLIEDIQNRLYYCFNTYPILIEHMTKYSYAKIIGVKNNDNPKWITITLDKDWKQQAMKTLQLI